MRTSARTLGGLAIFLLMLTSALANAQTANKNDANQPAASAPANQQKSKHAGNMSAAQSNPLYKDNKMEGTNPLYERDTAASQNKAKPTGSQSNPYFQESQNAGSMPDHRGRESAPGHNGNSSQSSGTIAPRSVQSPGTASSANHDVVEYKDGEDATTRYRQGNNKTTKVTPVGQPSSPSVVEYKDGEDGVSHTRPNKPK